MCASVGLLGSAPAREQPPTRPSGATNEMNRNNQDQDGAICIFHATHPPLPPASQAQHACVQRYDEGKGRRWAMARCRRVLFWCLVLPGGDCNGKNCECRAVGWLMVRRRRRYFFVGCRRRGNLCSLAHMEVVRGARYLGTRLGALSWRCGGGRISLLAPRPGSFPQFCRLGERMYSGTAHTTQRPQQRPRHHATTRTPHAHSNRATSPRPRLSRHRHAGPYIPPCKKTRGGKVNAKVER